MALNNRTRGAVSVIALFLIWTVLAPHAHAQRSSAEVDQAFEKATQLHQSGDLEGAIRAYTAILAQHPARVDVRSNLGAAYSRLGRYEDAIDQYKRALAVDSGNGIIRFNLGLAYYKAALFTEAVTELTRFISETQKGPEAATASLLIADSEVRLGDYKKVIAMLTPMAAADPEDRTVAYLLGSALIGDGQLNKGQEVIDRVFRDDNSAEARLLMGSLLLLADDAQGALKEVERALALNPKLPALQAWYGRVLMRLGDTEKAKASFKIELASNPNDFDANLYLGILLRQDKLTEEAQTYLSRAANLRPRDQYARYHLAAVYAALGKPDQARPLLEGVLKEHADFIEARVLLASVYYRLNRKDDGDREKAIIQKLNAEQQAKQPGSQDSPTGNPAPKPSPDPNHQNQLEQLLL